MPFADDWDFNFAAKVISHIDGILSYDTGGGAQAAVGQYVYGATSGALGKVLARTGNTTSGTLTLTNVLGQFADNELLEVLSELMFDGVVNAEKTRIVVGATLTGASSGSTMVIQFIEYNIDGVAGHGKFYGTAFSAAFTNNETLNISGSGVCLADGVGTDNDALLTTTLVDGTLAVPGTANTNNCAIINYDGGTIAIPEDAKIADATSGAVGYAQQVIGSTAIGSIRVIDSDTTGGAWTNNNTLNIRDVVFYDTLVAGKVFSVGDVIKAVNGTTPSVVGRVIAVIDDGDNTGKLILANFAGTRFADNEIHVLQPDDTYVKYADFENTTAILAAATINGSSRTLQRADQGGIFPTVSLNGIRSSNALYSYAAELYAAIAQLDDDPPLEGNVRDQLYTIINSYIIPDLSFRFLEKGSFKDSSNNNVWTAVQTTGALADIGAWGFFNDATNTTPQPDMYIEQNGAVIRQDWLEGNLDVVLKTKTSTSPVYINPTVNALGQLINNGAFTVHVRPYGRTYDSNEVTQVGGIAVVALGNAKDLNNTTAQYSATYNTGSGTFLAGEEATTTSGKRVIINAGVTGATGTITWNNKGATNLINTDVITGTVSGAAATLNSGITNVVAGYDTDIRVMVVQRRFTGGTTTGAYVIGELVTQTTSGATGYLMEDDGGTLYIEEQSGTFTGTDILTGAVSGATNDPTATAAFSTVPKDIGGGVGDIAYTAVVSANITNASPQTVAEVYEWWKFALRAESNYQVNTAGGLFSAFTLGRIYRRLQSTFSEVRGASPFGAKAGSLVITAQGVFIEKFTLDVADIRSIQLVANDGVAYNPPNLQTMQLTNLVSGVRGAIYRSTGAGLTTILRNEFAVGTVGAGNNQAADSTILVAASVRTVSPLPNDVPDTGVLRILDPADTGNYLRFVYDSVDRVTNIFSLQQGIGQNTIGDVTGAVDLTLADNVHVVFVEEQAVSTTVDNVVQYVSDVPLVAIARVKGKQPFRTTSTFSATGASIGAVLGADNVVNLP